MTGDPLLAQHEANSTDSHVLNANTRNLHAKQPRIFDILPGFRVPNKKGLKNRQKFVTYLKGHTKPGMDPVELNEGTSVRADPFASLTLRREEEWNYVTRTPGHRDEEVYFNSTIRCRWNSYMASISMRSEIRCLEPLCLPEVGTRKTCT